jgi:predicted DNA-binding protein (UPF0251 family)
MPRPVHCRRVSSEPDCTYFKPCGIPRRKCDEVMLELDEFEALRLSDFEGLYQEAAAGQMGISRQTFGNILTRARKKCADALVNGKSIRINGGHIEMVEREFMCAECRHTWSLPFGSGRPDQCPHCHCKNIHRDNPGRGRRAGDFGAGRGPGRCRRAGV